VEYEYTELEVADVESHHRAEVAFYRDYWSRIRNEIPTNGSILDVGCGAGELLRLCQANGYEGTGLELNSARLARARQSGCKVYDTPIEEFSPECRYDVITLINVLSHIPSFQKLFDAARRLLKPNGKLIFKLGELNPTVRRTDIPDWGIPDHLHFCGLGTIDYVCRKFQFSKSSHDRVPLAEQWLSPMRLRMPGRSRFRDILKLGVLYTPGARHLIRRIVAGRHGDRVFTSWVVLQPCVVE
jgi:SAM-dependent methyltransferase